MKKNKKNKIVVIVGPTSGGKTGLAVKLAEKYQGEVVSADSRQVYRGMDIGTGKDLDEYTIKKRNGKKIEIPYHLIDVVSPKTEFSLGKFYKKAQKAIKDILKRDKLPIVAGGTGLYTQALVDGYDLSTVKADLELREKLEKWDVEKLYTKLEKLDKEFADNLHISDKKNKRRLIRYIEIKLNKEDNNKSHNSQSIIHNSNYEYLIIGITWPMDFLRKRIYKRIVDRLDNEDMLGEVRRLHYEDKVSWKRLERFGLEYKFLSQHLQGKLEYDEMIEKLSIATGQFAKRQMSWYRRWEKQGTKINWVTDIKEADKLVKEFLK